MSIEGTPRANKESDPIPLPKYHFTPVATDESGNAAFLEEMLKESEFKDAAKNDHKHHGYKHFVKKIRKTINEFHDQDTVAGLTDFDSLMVKHFFQLGKKEVIKGLLTDLKQHSIDEVLNNVPDQQDKLHGLYVVGVALREQDRAEAAPEWRDNAALLGEIIRMAALGKLLRLDMKAGAGKVNNLIKSEPEYFSRHVDEFKAFADSKNLPNKVRNFARDIYDDLLKISRPQPESAQAPVVATEPVADTEQGVTEEAPAVSDLPVEETQPSSATAESVSHSKEELIQAFKYEFGVEEGDSIKDFGIVIGIFGADEGYALIYDPTEKTVKRYFKTDLEAEFFLEKPMVAGFSTAERRNEFVNSVMTPKQRQELSLIDTKTEPGSAVSDQEFLDLNSRRLEIYEQIKNRCDSAPLAGQPKSVLQEKPKDFVREKVSEDDLREIYKELNELRSKGNAFDFTRRLVELKQARVNLTGESKEKLRQYFEDYRKKLKGSKEVSPMALAVYLADLKKLGYTDAVDVEEKKKLFFGLNNRYKKGQSVSAFCERLAYLGVALPDQNWRTAFKKELEVAQGKGDVKEVAQILLRSKNINRLTEERINLQSTEQVKGDLQQSLGEFKAAKSWEPYVSLQNTFNNIYDEVWQRDETLENTLVNHAGQLRKEKRWRSFIVYLGDLFALATSKTKSVHH